MKPKSNYLDVLPKSRGLYYGGAWHRAHGGELETWNPATGESLGRCAEADAHDVDLAVHAAHEGYLAWRKVKPLERAALLKKVAAVLREHAYELAMIDARSEEHTSELQSH